MDAEHLKILENMQILHKCQDSKNGHMQTRMRQQTCHATDRTTGGITTADGIEDIDMDEVLEHLESIDCMSSRKQEEASLEAQCCIEELAVNGFFSTSHPMLAICDDLEAPELLHDANENLEDEWKDVYEKRKVAWKLEARDMGTDKTANTVSFNLLDGVQGGDINCSQIVDLTTTMVEANARSNESLVQRVANKWTLNKEQRQAFEIVAWHTLQDRPEQLLMYLGGPGGTGKLRVVNSSHDSYEERQQTCRFRLAAYTGVAARNIGGATLHTLLQMNESG